jgi:N-acetylglucosamine-6-sulfatase
MGYRAVRNARWKWIHYLELPGMDELYDLQADPYEMTNVIDAPRTQAVRDELRTELARLLRETTLPGSP